MAEGSAFCTGHTFFPWNEVCSYTKLINSEFRDEYKMAHGTFIPKGPGRAKMYDWSEKRRDPIPLPITGCEAAKPRLGGRPPRFGGRYTSSSAIVGGWWDDPLFMKIAKTRDERLPELPSVGFGKSSASECGAYFHTKGVFEADLNNPALRSKNGIKRLIPIELRSQFALEDLPIADRML